MSTYVVVVISPATTTRPVVIRVSQATRPVRVVRQDGVEDGVGDLVGDLVRVPLGDRLRAEAERAGAHRRKRSRSEPASYSEVGSRCISVADEVAERDAVEDGADALGDRHLDLEPVREVAQHGRGRQALDDHADLGHGLRGRRALGDELAAAAVAARLRPAGDDQVAHARRARRTSRASRRPPRRSAPISASPRATSAAFALSPSPRPSAPPAASAITFFAAAQARRRRRRR